MKIAVVDGHSKNRYRFQSFESFGRKHQDYRRFSIPAILTNLGVNDALKAQKALKPSQLSLNKVKNETLDIKCDGNEHYRPNVISTFSAVQYK